MSRYRAWVSDSSGTHTPSHPFGTRRAAEVFAANRSVFRRDCFLIVRYDGEERCLTTYRDGALHSSCVNGAFNPERVCVQVKNGATVYALAQKESA